MVKTRKVLKQDAHGEHTGNTPETIGAKLKCKVEPTPTGEARPAVPHLEQAVSRALLNIPSELDKILSHRYGLGSGEPMTVIEEAIDSGLSPEEIRMKEAQALRILMGYGKRIV